MTYGYYNGFITDIGEDVPSGIEALKKYADVIEIESLSSRICLAGILERLQPDDILYVYSFLRFCSGLRDLCGLLEVIIDEKGAHVISLTDDFDSRTEAGRAAKAAYKNALRLINADPSYGFFK